MLPVLFPEDIVKGAVLVCRILNIYPDLLFKI